MGILTALSFKNGINANSKNIINVADPVNAQDAATKNFSSNANNLSTGTLPVARLPAFTGDATVAVGTNTITLANSGVVANTYGTSLNIPRITVDAKGRVTGVTSVAIQAATTAQEGVVKLNSAVNSTSVTEAATPAAVKVAYDLANAAIPLTQKGAANGVVQLDATSKVPTAQLPAFVGNYGRLIGMRVFTPANSGQAYTPTAGTLAVLVEVIAAGGGGGGGSNATGASMGGGGGGGGFASSYLTSGFSGITMTIGSGGNGATGNAAWGSNGGNSSFGSLIVTTGGGGGGPGGQWPANGGGISFGGAGGLASAGTVKVAGVTGLYGIATYSLQGFAGWGGASYYGGGGSGGWNFGNAANNGQNAPAAGGGGGGASSSYTAVNSTGGRGGDGMIVIYEFG